MGALAWGEGVGVGGGESEGERVRERERGRESEGEREREKERGCRTLELLVRHIDLVMCQWLHLTIVIIFICPA